MNPVLSALWSNTWPDPETIPPPDAINTLLPSTANTPAEALVKVVSDALPILTPANWGESSVCIALMSTFWPFNFIWPCASPVAEADIVPAGAEASANVNPVSPTFTASDLPACPDKLVVVNPVPPEPTANCVSNVNPSNSADEPETTTFFHSAIILNFNYCFYFLFLKCCTPYNIIFNSFYHKYVTYSTPT